MFGKTTAGLTAALIIVIAYLLPLALPLAAARFLPGVELTTTPTTIPQWAGMFLAAGFLLWLSEMAGKWARLQALVFNIPRQYARACSFATELVLSTFVFRLILTSLPIAALCALALLALSTLVDSPASNLHQ